MARGRERDLAQEHDVVARADDLFDLGAHAPQIHAEVGQHLRRHAFAQGDQAQEDVLRSHVIVVQALGFFLSDQDDTLRPFGKTIRH